MNFKKVLAGACVGALVAGVCAFSSFAEATTASTIAKEGSAQLVGSNWWAQQGLSIQELIGDADPADIAYIEFAGDTEFFVGFNGLEVTGQNDDGSDSYWVQYSGKTTYSIDPSEICWDEGAGANPAYSLNIAVSKVDDLTYNISWKAVLSADESSTEATEDSDESSTEATEDSDESSTEATEDSDESSTEATEDSDESSTETTTAASEEVAGQEGSAQLVGSNWWAQQALSIQELIGDADPADVASIEFTGDTDFFVGFNGVEVTGQNDDGSDSYWVQYSGKTAYSIDPSEICWVEDEDADPAYYLCVAVSKDDGVTYTVSWKVVLKEKTEETTGTEETKATEASKETEATASSSETTTANGSGNDTGDHAPVAVLAAAVVSAMGVALVASKKKFNA